MSKKILLCTLFIAIFLIPSKQDPNAKTWKRSNTTVDAESTLAAIDRGDSVIIDSCEIFGPVIKRGTWEIPDTITSFIRIWHSSFYDTVSFFSCCFMKAVSFQTTLFRSPAIFSKTTFKQTGDFLGSTFHGTADFSDATFEKGAIFWASIFEKDVDFWSAKFSGALFLGATFRKEVNFSPEEFQGIAISWEQLEGHLSSTSYYYYKLMKWFEDQRLLDDADGVYLFLKDQERMEKRWYIRYPEYWFIQQTCGYGVKPWRPLITSALVIILFTFIYLILDTQEKEPLNLDLANPGRQTFKWRSSRGFYYSINAFIIGAPPNWTVGNGHSQKWFRIWTTIERTLGWILLVLFVVTLTRKFIR
jgi:hypothetical protein